MARNTDFGSDLRAAREAAGLTQIELALRLGVDPGAVSNWERPKSNRMPNDENRAAVARFMGLTIADYLVRYEARDGVTRQGPSPTREKAGGRRGEPSQSAEELAQEALERLDRLERMLGRFEQVLGEQEQAQPQRARASRSRR